MVSSTLLFWDSHRYSMSSGIFLLVCWKSACDRQQCPVLLLTQSWATTIFLFYFYKSYYSRYIIYGKITQHLSFWSWLISLPLSVFTFHSPLCMSESPSLLRLKILYCTDTHTDYRMSAEQIDCFSLSSHHESCCYKHGHTHVPLISRNSKWASKRINEWMTTPTFRELRGGQPDWEMLGKKRWEREGAISLMILCKAGADQNLVCVSLCNGLWCYLSKSALLWVHKSLLH